MKASLRQRLRLFHPPRRADLWDPTLKLVFQVFSFSFCYFVEFCCWPLGIYFVLEVLGPPPSHIPKSRLFCNEVEKCVVDPSQEFGDTNTYHCPGLYTKLQVPKVQRRLVVLTNLGEPISFNPKKQNQNLYLWEFIIIRCKKEDKKALTTPGKYQLVHLKEWYGLED